MYIILILLQNKLQKNIMYSMTSFGFNYYWGDDSSLSSTAQLSNGLLPLKIRIILKRKILFLLSLYI